MGAILVAQLDIVAATIERLRRLLLSLEEDGVRLISIAEGISIPGPTAELVLATLQACARSEWLLICDLLHAGLQYRYKSKARGPETKHYGLRPGEELVVERVRQLRLDGQSFESIAGILDRDGVPPRRGGRWSRKIVAKLVERPVRHYRFREHPAGGPRAPPRHGSADFPRKKHRPVA